MLSEFVAHALAYAILAVATLPVLALLRGSVTAASPRPLFRPFTFDLLAMMLLGLALPAVTQAFLEQSMPITRFDVTSTAERQAVAYILALPLWLAVLLVWLRQCGVDFAAAARGWARDLAAGIAGFLLITPITFAVFAIVVAILTLFGGKPDPHPLTQTDTSTPLGVAIVLLSACLAAPLFEETIFRGLLLPWARVRRWRPWLVFAIAVAVLLNRWGFEHLGAMLFLFDLTTLMAFAAFGRELWKKWPSRTAASIFASAAAWGLLHPWPTPIPLTVLGVGLGILTVRCGSVRPAIVAHALFNAVSAMVLLSGHAK